MTEAAPALEDLFRQEAGKICAWLVRLLGPGRLELIEDAVQDAFSAALAQWRFEGTPQRPAAWLAIAARNKALDRLRREMRLESLDPSDEAAAWRLGFSNPEDTGKPDDTLALMFVACHPALSDEEQTMLTLQAVCGFNAQQIARAFLSTPEAVTQRLVRAKRRLRDLKLTVEIPEGAELAGRLPGLLNAIYQLFTGGYTAAEGDQLMTEQRCAEALRLVTLLCEHPHTSTGETHALAALICFHHARAAARTGATGDVVLLAEQDRARWDAGLLARGFGHLRGAMAAPELTALHLEAGIAAVHASAPSFAQTDWPALVHYYQALIELKPTPVVKLNAAIAQGYADGPGAGLAQLDELAGSTRLSRYAHYHAARGDLLLKLGRQTEAGAALRQALECPLNGAERDYLVRKLRACSTPAQQAHS
ncbi:MAG TPA: sigma-70 family RNA polymerase sigma factor [Steroidobacteraceae bacterium]